MRSNTNTGGSRIPATTRSSASTGVPPRTQATSRPTVSRASVSAGRGTGRARTDAPSLSSVSGTSRPLATRTTNTRHPVNSTGSASAVGAPSNASSRRVVATAERDALQAEMDALADEFYGDVATAAPYRASATPATTSASTSAGGHTDGVYNKTDVRQGVALPVLRSQTTWYSGPTNPEGRVFDASDSNLLCMDVLVPPSAAGAKSASTSASLCVVGSADHGLKVFNLDSMREVKSLYTKSCGHTDWVTSCRFLSDRRVLSGGMDSKLCLWSDVTRGGPARCVDLLGHTGSISQVEVNERQGRIVAMSASYDRTIRIWELSGAAAGGGRETGCLAGHKGPVTQFSWCETQLLSGDRQGTVKLWDVETAQCHVTASSRRGQIGALGHLSHPDVGHLVMFGDQGGVLTVLDARAPPKAKPVFQEELHPAGMVTFIRAPVASAVAAPLVLTCGADKRIVACDARQNFTAVYTVSDHDDFVYSMEILGNLLLTGAGNGRLLVHNVETGALCYELDANAAAVREIFASPGKLVTSGDDGKAKVFDFM